MNLWKEIFSQFNETNDEIKRKYGFFITLLAQFRQITAPQAVAKPTKEFPVIMLVKQEETNTTGVTLVNHGITVH